MTTIDINADLGEGFPNDATLLDLVTSTSVCCGAHAGDRDTIRATLDAARARGVVVGAHPGYPDREGFGRRTRAATAAQVEGWLVEQVEALAELAGAAGVALRFVKPHGSLYNQAQVEEEIARGVVSAVRRWGLPVLGLPNGLLGSLVAGASLRYVPEGFPDRRTGPDGRLVPRSRPDAVIHDPSEFEAQVRRLVDGGAQTLCLHGDLPDAVANAERLRATLARLGIAPRFWGAEG